MIANKTRGLEKIRALKGCTRSYFGVAKRNVCSCAVKIAQRNKYGDRFQNVRFILSNECHKSKYSTSTKLELMIVYVT